MLVTPVKTVSVRRRSEDRGQRTDIGGQGVGRMLMARFKPVYSLERSFDTQITQINAD
jgi:hypothetical protein